MALLTERGKIFELLIRIVYSFALKKKKKEEKKEEEVFMALPDPTYSSLDFISQ